MLQTALRDDEPKAEPGTAPLDSEQAAALMTCMAQVDVHPRRREFWGADGEVRCAFWTGLVLGAGALVGSDRLMGHTYIRTLTIPKNPQWRQGRREALARTLGRAFADDRKFSVMWSESPRGCVGCVDACGCNGGCGGCRGLTTMPLCVD